MNLRIIVKTLPIGIFYLIFISQTMAESFVIHSNAIPSSYSDVIYHILNRTLRQDVDNDMGIKNRFLLSSVRLR